MEFTKRPKHTLAVTVLLVLTIIIIGALFILVSVGKQNFTKVSNAVSLINIQDSSVVYLQKMHSELFESENSYRQFLASRNKEKATEYKAHLNKVKYYLDVWKAYINQKRNLGVESYVNKKDELYNAIQDLNNLSDSVIINLENINFDQPEKFVIRTLPVTYYQKLTAAAIDTIRVSKSKKKTGFLGLGKSKTVSDTVYNKGNSRLDSISKSSGLSASQLSGLQASKYVNQFYINELNRLQALRKQRDTEEQKLAGANLNFINKLTRSVETLMNEWIATDNQQKQNAIALAESASLKLKSIAITACILVIVLITFLLYFIFRSFKYERELIKASALTQKLADTKTRFLNNITHEIRSPLTAIIGFTDQIKEEQFDTENKNYLAGIKTSSDHLLNTVNDVLDFSKLDAGKLKIDAQPFALKKTIEEVIFAFTVLAKQKNIGLNAQLNISDDVVVKGDAFRLKQILYNLISNAVKFTKKGAVNVTANITTTENPLIKIAVKDSGIGIPEDKINFVFEEFTQVGSESDSATGIRGTGLGLPIAKMIAKQQQGDITVKSKYGEGSEFELNLPYIPTKALVISKTPVVTPEMILPESFKILVVEDNTLNAMIVGKMLVNNNINYHLAKTGEEAITLFEKNTYDVVVTDINLPDISGWQVATYIAKHSNKIKAATAVLAFTANIIDEESTEFVEAEMKGFIVKPFKEADFISALHKHGQPFN